VAGPEPTALVSSPGDIEDEHLQSSARLYDRTIVMTLRPNIRERNAAVCCLQSTLDTSAIPRLPWPRCTLLTPAVLARVRAVAQCPLCTTNVLTGRIGEDRCCRRFMPDRLTLGFPPCMIIHPARFLPFAAATACRSRSSGIRYQLLFFPSGVPVYVLGRVWILAYRAWRGNTLAGSSVLIACKPITIDRGAAIGGVLLLTTND